MIFWGYIPVTSQYHLIVHQHFFIKKEKYNHCNVTGFKLMVFRMVWKCAEQTNLSLQEPKFSFWTIASTSTTVVSEKLEAICGPLFWDLLHQTRECSGNFLPSAFLSCKLFVVTLDNPTSPQDDPREEPGDKYCLKEEVDQIISYLKNSLHNNSFLRHGKVEQMRL